MPTTFLAEDALVAASLLGWPGVPVTITGLEAPVVAVVVIDEDDHDARQGAPVRALLDLRSLAVLWELPYRIAVPERTLSAQIRSRLRRFPPALVVFNDHSFERRVRVPVRISGVVADAATWPRSAAALGAFVTVAPRVVVLGGDDPLPVTVHAEALVWEIGLVRRGLHPEVRLEPGPAGIEHGPFQWWLAERAYADWLRTSTERPRPPVVASPEMVAWPGSRSSPRA